MPEDKTDPKWVLPVLSVVAVWFGMVVIYDLVRGETPQLFEVAILVMFAALAIEKWLKRRKKADAPEPQPEESQPNMRFLCNQPKMLLKPLIKKNMKFY